MEKIEEEEAPVKQQPREKPNILITGTPGTGKTTLSKLLCEYVEGLKHVNLSSYIVQEKLYKEWNQDFDVPEFDEDLVCDFLENSMQQGGVVIDFHSCAFFPERWFDLVVLLRCNNTELYDRLKQRNYTEKKITENIECEILEVTADDVHDSYKKEITLELKSEKKEDMEENLNKIIQFLQQWQLSKADKQQ